MKKRKTKANKQKGSEEKIEERVDTALDTTVEKERVRWTKVVLWKEYEKTILERAELGARRKAAAAVGYVSLFVKEKERQSLKVY